MILAILLGALALAAPPDEPEISFDIWDWTAPAQDLDVFDRWVADLAETGVTRIEISAPWKRLEPQPGVYDLSWLADRLAVCKRYGLGMRLRINSYYAGATPDWYDGDQWTDQHGVPVPWRIPSFMEERFWTHYGGLCTRIAELCRGEDVFYSAFIGIHAELKWSDWWSYDPSTLAHWRAAIQASPRPDWLRAVAGDAALPEVPPAPGPTQGLPDTDPVSRAWIAFREWCWRDALDRFRDALREGDPAAGISSPLGESYRQQSAQMSNLDYRGLSRVSDQVVHSYDFFWHGGGQPAWNAGAAVESFRGITGLPVCFEYDSFDHLAALGFSHQDLMDIGREALVAGAGLKMANNTYTPQMPSDRAILRDLVALWQSDLARAPRQPDFDADRGRTVLLFVSKWANYSYRESGPWLHDAQFGVYKALRDLGIPLRFVCEDNLAELLSGWAAGPRTCDLNDDGAVNALDVQRVINAVLTGAAADTDGDGKTDAVDIQRAINAVLGAVPPPYRLMYLAFSPRDVMPPADRALLDALRLPKIEDSPDVPPRYHGPHPIRAEGLVSVSVSAAGCPVGPVDLAGLGGAYQYALSAAGDALGAYRPGHVVLGYPLGYLYLHGDTSAQRTVLEWALDQAKF